MKTTKFYGRFLLYLAISWLLLPAHALPNDLDTTISTTGQSAPVINVKNVIYVAETQPDQDKNTVNYTGTYRSEISSNFKPFVRDTNLKVHLVQNGSEITGYLLDAEGRIYGEIDGNTIEFTFRPPVGRTYSITGLWVFETGPNEAVGKIRRQVREGHWNLTRIDEDGQLAVPSLAMQAEPDSSLLKAGDGNFYTGIQYSRMAYERQIEEDITLDLNPTVAVLRFGRYINEFVAVEGRFGIGLDTDDANYPGFNDIFYDDYEFEIDSMYGIYAVLGKRHRSSPSLYGVVGYTVVDATLTRSCIKFAHCNGEISRSELPEESGFSLGFGLSFGSMDRVRFTFEYMSYLDHPNTSSADPFKISAFSFGVQF